jgi:hypothetical protein
MKIANYIFIIILLVLFIGIQYISTVILITKEPAYVEMMFNEPYIKNVNLEVHNADLVLRIPKGGQVFDNCTFLIDGGNIDIHGANWESK